MWKRAQSSSPNHPDYSEPGGLEYSRRAYRDDSHRVCERGIGFIVSAEQLGGLPHGAFQKSKKLLINPFYVRRRSLLGR